MNKMLDAILAPIAVLFLLALGAFIFLPAFIIGKLVEEKSYTCREKNYRREIPLKRL